MNLIKVVGGGLAGCEAAWQIARRGFPVQLFEMKPQVRSAAHRTDDLAELVCSNSLKSRRQDRASGLLKEELRLAGSLLLEIAEKASIPGGSSLCVDRREFAHMVTEALNGSPLIELIREEVTTIPKEGIVVIASGPLTSDPLTESIRNSVGTESLFFYDAIAPTIEADSISWDEVFLQDRYQDPGSGAYVNCPLDEDQYQALVSALRTADPLKPHEFEDARYFEACMPIEELASRGDRTLAYGSWRPVGLTNPKTGKRPHAVIQLRPENRAATSYSMVGFQTRLLFPDQERIFRTIPGLGKASFERLGTIHRNTYVDAPSLLDRTQRLLSDPRLFFCGQIAGVEGYVESMASGLITGLNVAAFLKDHQPVPLPETTMTGAILQKLTSTEGSPFTPVNAQFGLLPPLPDLKLKKDVKRQKLAERALQDMKGWLEGQNVECRT
ncbi:MAG: methylenetetrahydrofolate--tRNA-(uracil(54)-C(5))-methyltransferase (FADH(2)-oxidizing) TrmFO [bacterium]|nr:methylenetetrahydrofolate--tRNA-(uracil(54)-C(5))-methyltransferase (FADH(2)-oxidizing) TrmFO [bacterium]MDT8366616.1 methylenetetrahydrofolate--tRNA-(uracil(54)-C(5))-methyltransferase (FADH(2)-oxidizing) TrmFO [bacterium]